MKYSRFLTVLLLLAAAVLVLGGCSGHRETSPVTWPLVPFVKADDANPVLEADSNKFVCPVLNKEVKWDEKDVFNPAVVVRDNKVYMIFRAEDKIGKYAGTSRLGLATSDDGLHFTKRAEPVFYPANDSMKIYEWEGGVEDPRIVESDDGVYYMTYTAYDGNLARLCLASSPDLITWTKHGLVLKGKYTDTWSKSGAIVAERKGEKIVAKKVNNKYWMYFGDTDLFIASSDDLIHWIPVEDNGALKSVLKPRPMKFDSRLVESGPYALVTSYGILLLYNGMNLDEGGDPNLAKGAYCSGQALFDANDPAKLVDRLEKHFLMPDKPYELTGQINQVVFIEGMAPFKGRWYLYYGTADSKIAAAVGPEVK
jgi:beta-1,2-mannosidase